MATSDEATRPSGDPLPRKVSETLQRTGWEPRQPSRETLERAARAERAKRYGVGSPSRDRVPSSRK